MMRILTVFVGELEHRPSPGFVGARDVGVHEGPTVVGDCVTGILEGSSVGAAEEEEDTRGGLVEGLSDGVVLGFAPAIVGFVLGRIVGNSVKGLAVEGFWVGVLSPTGDRVMVVVGL